MIKFLLNGYTKLGISYLSDGNTVRNPPNVNRYHMSIVKPGISDFLQSSDLKIEYENVSGIERLNWNNKVNPALDYVTEQQVNIYQMPLEMVLIKQ